MPNLSADEAQRRLQAVRRWMREEQLDALLALDAANIRYLTGYAGEGIQAFVSRRGAWALASRRNVQRATRQTRGYTVVDTKERPGFLKQWVKRHGEATVGLEPSLRYGQVVQRRRSLRPARAKVTDAVREARAVKSPFEIRRMRTAQRHAEKVLDRILAEIRPGMTEHQVHNRIIQLILDDTDLDGPAFAPIVASGPSAWASHSYYTERRIRRNDCVILDLGVRYRGYCSDMTRTVFLGKPTRKMRDIYAIVLEAQERAIAAIKPGALGKDVDAAARGLIKEHGYGEAFAHGLGHGVGLEVHELPGLSGGKAPLREGMVVTVEPGIYLANAFGVRIEDTVVVRARGCENLTRTPKALTTIG